MSMAQLRAAGFRASRPAATCTRLHSTWTRLARSHIVKAGDTPRSIEDILNEANQLLAAVESGVVPSVSSSASAADSAPPSGVVCDESGCSIRLPSQGSDGTSSILSRSLSGDNWSIQLASNATIKYPSSITGPFWTIHVSQEELKDILEAILSVRKVVTNLHEQGDWHSTLQSSAQWRVNHVLARATYAEGASQEAFDLAITLDPKSRRPVVGQWPAPAVAALLAALDTELLPSTAVAPTTVTASTA